MAELRYRGREIDQEDILYIRTLIERYPERKPPQAVDPDM